METPGKKMLGSAVFLLVVKINMTLCLTNGAPEVTDAVGHFMAFRKTHESVTSLWLHNDFDTPRTIEVDFGGILGSLGTNWAPPNLCLRLI